MKKIDVYVIEDGENQVFCIYEEVAREEASARNKNYLSTKVTNPVFEQMVQDHVFFDTDLFVSKKEPQNESTTTPVKENEEQNKLLSMVKELKTMLDSLKAENEQLKKRPRLTLEQAKELHDKKQVLLSNKEIFDDAKDKINRALNSFSDIIDFHENETFRLVMYNFDYQTNKGKEIFSINTNHVIQNTMKYVKNEVLNKMADIDFSIQEIENQFV